MAFSLTAIVGSTTQSLSDGSPFRVLGISGFGGATVRRVTAQGPAQDGDTDIGYRLGPRDFTLTIGFKATTDAILDGYRDLLVGIFKPLTATPIVLKVIRDDGEIRAVDCYTRGKIGIEWEKKFRPGHYHKATIPLRAPNPAWYEFASGTATVTGAPGTAADWYLAGGAIGTAQVMMSGGTPSQGGTWSYAGSIAYTTSYTLAFRAAKETLGTANKYAFYVDNSEGNGELDLVFIAGTAAYLAGTSPTSYSLGTSFMPTGISNYYVTHDQDALPLLIDEYRGNGNSFYPGFPNDSAFRRPIGGSTRRWRSDAANSVASRWSSTIHLYALYSPRLSDGQLTALDAYMGGGIGGTTYQYLNVPYLGDLIEYPIVRITGPIVGPTITNTTSHDTLSFSTVTIAAGSTYVIDTRPGIKTVTVGTVNKRGELDAGSELDTFHLEPRDIDGAGNYVLVYGTGTNSNTSISIIYYNRFSSF